MAKIFTKLNVGDTVATSGTRVFKKLTTEEVPPLPITDLTGTTWLMKTDLTGKSGWFAEAGYGVFDVRGEAILQSIGFNSRHNLQSFCVGYGEDDANNTFPSSNSVCFVKDGAVDSYDKGYVITLIFSGGADVTNKRLIKWVLDNGEVASPIAGTWVFNDTITELPIFDDTQEDVYGGLGYNQARAIDIYIAEDVDYSTGHFCMCNRDYDGTLIESCLLGFKVFGGFSHPFYYYGTNTFFNESAWSENANNELTILATSKFDNVSGVDVSDKFLAWLKANATKKEA